LRGIWRRREAASRGPRTWRCSLAFPGRLRSHGRPALALVVAAVAACWWFAERDRSVVAGLVLSAIALKPQLALFVPLCLLVSGHARVFGAWAVASLVIALVALAIAGH